jgi:hypothetical protein
MIEINIHGNFGKLIANLSAFDERLDMLNVPLLELEDLLKKVYEVKFRNFDRFRDRLSPSYRKWKDKKGLPVGVKTGKTKKALTEGTDGRIEGINPNAKGGFVYTYGIHADSFEDRRGYPRSFDQWLQKHGDDLIGLSDQEADLILDELTVNVNKLISSFLR